MLPEDFIVSHIRVAADELGDLRGDVTENRPTCTVKFDSAHPLLLFALVQATDGFQRVCQKSNHVRAGEISGLDEAVLVDNIEPVLGTVPHIGGDKVSGSGVVGHLDGDGDLQRAENVIDGDAVDECEEHVLYCTD